MTQLNTPYPATAHLAGFLKKKGFESVQADLSIELALKLFSSPGLRAIRNRIPPETSKKKPLLRFFEDHFEEYEARMDSVIRFLQGKDPSMALRLVEEGFLPEGPSFALLKSPELESLNLTHWAFGQLGLQDHAKYRASLLIDDLAEVIRQGVDPRFGLTRYAEKLAASAASYDSLREGLDAGAPTLVDELIDELAEEVFRKHEPEFVALSVPFPGNLYGALRIARKIKKLSPQTGIALGGGYPNTELRELEDPRIFDEVDAITLDDGELPLLRLLEARDPGRVDPAQLVRTWIRSQGRVVYCAGLGEADVPHREKGTPTYGNLPLGSYLSLFEMLNPMHRLWSDSRWNKLTVAHGCYWRKCTFCDVTLDYIHRYDPAPVKHLADQMEALIEETGQSGFHFVDEAAPPVALKNLAEELIRRKRVVSWWGNIRFEKTFTRELTELLARSGCVAVSGGLEVASERVLKLIQKGVTVEQVARVCRNFTDSGVLVHAYLMYGFPTQTAQETIDSLERVRQLFRAGCIQSAYWHRFSATAHSPVGKNPEKYGIRLLSEEKPKFARNDLEFEDPTGCDHAAFGEGLRKALYNYMHGMGLDEDVRQWFEFQVPKAKVAKGWISAVLKG